MAETKQVGATPGPWRMKLRDLRDDEIEYRILAGADIVVAELSNLHVGTEVAEANARLMTAAPDLLEACKAALAASRDMWGNARQWTKTGKVHAVLEAAIAKAEQS